MIFLPRRGIISIAPGFNRGEKKEAKTVRENTLIKGFTLFLEGMAQVSKEVVKKSDNSSLFVGGGF